MSASKRVSVAELRRLADKLYAEWRRDGAGPLAEQMRAGALALIEAAKEAK
jgi:hypothetical protein